MLLSKTSFNELADYHSAQCVSIFLPTHRAGMEVNRREDEILFKNLLKRVYEQLELNGFSKLEIENYLEPAYALLENSNFWNNQSDGLAIFIGNHFFKYYILPIPFEEFIYHANHFYLKPLLPLYNNDGRFFLLTLSLEEVRFFEGSRYSITERTIENITPNTLEEAVGYDYEQKSLQFHSAQRGAGRAIFHGRGEGSDEDKKEIKAYFKAVNDGLMKILNDEKAPLVIASVDQWLPIYKEVNTYSNLYHKNISGSPERHTSVNLHEKAWTIIEPHFQKARQEQVRFFDELGGTQRVSSELEDIISASINGKVETLFIQSRQEVYGIFDPTTQTVSLEDKKRVANAALLNLAAIKTFQQGGSVFLMESKEMPIEDTLVNAIFRY